MRAPPAARALPAPLAASLAFRRYLAARLDSGVPLSEQEITDICASFQRAVTDVLVTKTMAAAEATGARSVALAGGVAANSELRQRLAQRFGVRVARLGGMGSGR